jgi:hypothetical protein
VRSETSWHQILDRSTFEIACRRVDDVLVLRANETGLALKFLCRFVPVLCRGVFVSRS